MGRSTNILTNAMRRQINRAFYQERMFRLNRLGRRYPNYINHSQIQRWSNERYQDQLLRTKRLFEMTLHGFLRMGMGPFGIVVSEVEEAQVEVEEDGRH